MKKLALIAAAVICTVTSAFGQAGKRSIASIESDDKAYEVFAYDEDGVRGYYLLMGDTGYEVTSKVSLNSEFLELFVYLGSNVNEAADTMKGVIALYDAPIGDYKMYTGRLGGNLPIGASREVKAVVQKKLLSKKTQLSFTFVGDQVNIVSWMKKSDAKMLSKFLTSYQKRHPDR